MCVCVCTSLCMCMRLPACYVYTCAAEYAGGQEVRGRSIDIERVKKERSRISLIKNHERRRNFDTVTIIA